MHSSRPYMQHAGNESKEELKQHNTGANNHTEHVWSDKVVDKKQMTERVHLSGRFNFLWALFRSRKCAEGHSFIKSEWKRGRGGDEMCGARKGRNGARDKHTRENRKKKRKCVTSKPKMCQTDSQKETRTQQQARQGVGRVCA